MPRTVLLGFLLLTGLASSRCNLRGDWYDPITGQRGCAAAPHAIDYWASGRWLRRPEDRTELEAFLARHPGAVNARYGAPCETPLHSAARSGREDIVPVLIAHGADLRARDKRGETPIQVAATFGRMNVMTLLLAAGANVNAAGPTEQPPLHNAVGGVPGAPDLETGLAMTRLLLAAGADINAKDQAGRTALITAIGSGPRADNIDNAPLIELLVEHGADVRTRDSQGTAALGYAAGTGNLRIVALLLDRGADADGSGKKDEVALGDALSGAAYEGYVEIAALLIDRGADVNWRFRGPQPVEWRALPLALALAVARSRDEPTMTRRREVALVLLANGADVNARNQSEETLLHAAAMQGDMAVIELLLSHGAAVAARDRAGFTPLHRAVQHGHVDAAMRLIASGADANAVTIAGTTALDLASSDRAMRRSSAVMRSIELTLLVILGCTAAGCRPSCLDADDTRRVFDAAWTNDVPAMRDLLERDASLATATGCGSLQGGSTSVVAARMSGLRSPLLVAARQGHAEIVKLLLAHGAPVDAADAYGDTALHLAARYGHDEAVKVLIAAHASIDARSRGNLTALDAAATSGRFVAVKLLLAAGADVNRREMEGYRALHSAAQGGDADVARLLLEHGAKIDGQTDRGVTPLQSAIVGRHNDVAALLMARGADVNRGNKDTTPLLLALSMGDANAVGQLIRQGADVNAPSAHGGSPLQAIIRERRRGDQFDDQIRVREQEKMRLLLAAGANLRARTEDGNMPLHLAAMYDRDDLAELLIARGTDVNARNTSEWTPLHFAAQRGHTVVVEVLLAHGADVNAQGRDGLTPLNQVWGNDAMKRLLERHGGHVATVGR